MNSFDLLDKLVKAACFIFDSDPTRPGVTISSLRNGQYYCSVVRYLKSGKVVVCKATKFSLYEALQDVSFKLLESSRVKTPIEELAEAII